MLDLENCSDSISLRFFRPNCFRPGQRPLQKVEHEVQKRLHIIPPTHRLPPVVPNTRKLQINHPILTSLVLTDVLQTYRILEATRSPEINDKQLPLLLPLPQHEAPRHNLVMNEVFEMEVLQYGDDLLSEHEHGLQREFSIADCQQ